MATFVVPVIVTDDVIEIIKQTYLDKFGTKMTDHQLSEYIQIECNCYIGNDDFMDEDGLRESLSNTFDDDEDENDDS